MYEIQLEIGIQKPGPDIFLSYSKLKFYFNDIELQKIKKNYKDYRFGLITIGCINMNSLNKSKNSNALYGILDSETISLGEGTLSLYRLKEDLNVAETSQINTKYFQGSNIICVLAIPAYMNPSDFIKFLGSFKDDISHIRIIKDVAPNKYMAVMKFKEEKMGERFVSIYEGRKFNSFEKEVCHCLPIKRVIFKAPMEFSMSEFEEDRVGNETEMIKTEIPTCPVCLERMNSSITGLLTILCQHTFHCHCLKKWGDSSCPICRYTHHSNFIEGTSESDQNSCQICQSKDNLWICLICGNVGCGRYQKAHAEMHYTMSSHLYALELDTQRVWDYAGDGYVHRLIQNKNDGKLVEFPDDSMTDNNPETSGTEKTKKGEDIALEYATTLTTQLDSQRLYYEDRIKVLVNQVDVFSDKFNKIEAEFSAFKIDNEEIRSLNSQLIAENKEANKNIKAVQKKYLDEKEFNARLMEKQKLVYIDVEKLKKNNKDLDEQVQDLMFFINTQEKVKSHPDLENADIIINKK